MRERRISPFDFSVPELDRELIARSSEMPKEELFKFAPDGVKERDVVMSRIKELYDSPPPKNPAMKSIPTNTLARALMFKIGKLEIDGVRGAWETDDRLDIYELDTENEIGSEQILNNASSVASICLNDALEEIGNGCFQLKVASYRETYNLCESEKFCNQPNIIGRACTGFLVDEDIIATAAHCIDGYPLQNLRFVFGYKMLDACNPKTGFNERDIYKANKILARMDNYRSNHSDWAFVQLDRKVEGRHHVKISEREVYSEQEVYTIGHPCGLPLKFAPKASVTGVHPAKFGASMDIYSGNSGSPVFSSNTHELVGIVIHGYARDFRWTGKCWTTVIYPSVPFGSKPSHCTRVSEFLPTFNDIRKFRNSSA